MELFIQGTSDDVVPNPLNQSRYNTAKADWKRFRSEVVKLAKHYRLAFSNDEFSYVQDPLAETRRIIQEDNCEGITGELNRIAQTLTEIITKAADVAIPRVSTSPRAKAWWTPELKELRAKMSRNRRDVNRGECSTTRAYCEARNKYFEAVKQAKSDHWNTFLQKEDPKSIFKAMKYTNGNRVQRMPNIKDHLQQPQNTFEGK